MQPDSRQGERGGNVVVPILLAKMVFEMFVSTSCTDPSQFTGLPSVARLSRASRKTGNSGKIWTSVQSWKNWC